jgi:tol-pal system protein YbgF
LKVQIKFFVLVLLIVAVAGPAYPQNKDIVLLNRDVLDVRERINQLQMSVDRNNEVIKALLERMADQVNTLSGGLQKVSQTVDGLNSKGDTLSRDLKGSIKTLSDTVHDMQSDLSAARGQVGELRKELTTLKTTSEQLPSSDDLWRTAYTDYSAGNWSLAVGGFQDFLSKFPTDARAAEAQLKIGDAYKEQKKYDAAIDQYDIVLQKYPDSDKTKTALLKKGLAQADANQPQAIATLTDVAKKFPGTQEAISAQAKIKELQPAQRGKTPAR